MDWYQLTIKYRHAVQGQLAVGVHMVRGLLLSLILIFHHILIDNFECDMIIEVALNV